MADVLGFMRKAAPWLSAAATGNVPALVGLAAQTVGGIIGGKVDAHPDAIAAAVAGASPEQLMQFQLADKEIEARMNALGFQSVTDLEKIAADDRANAREREKTLKDHLPAVLAIGVTLGFFGVLLLAFIKGVNEQSRDLANIMIGTLGTAWVSVISYYFGSSAGSAQKTDLLAKSGGK